MVRASSIRLEFSDGHPALIGIENIDAINAALSTVGAGVWPFDLSAAPPMIRTLVAQPDLSDADKTILLDHFWLPRERLMETLAAAGRDPNVPGGGALETRVANQDYGYPQLWTVRANTDYRRFDRFHVNVSHDGTGVDEVLQMLSGIGVVVQLQTPDGGVLTLRLDCPGAEQGWLITYNGGRPHIGSLSSAMPGTKLVVQAFGPPVWSLSYDLP
jgi:hypothetical protein